MKKILVIILALVVAFGLANVATAQTFSTSVEIPTRSILLIDRSGSMEDREAVEVKLASIDLEAFDAVRYFDSANMTPDESYSGGYDSNLCEAIDAAVTGGFDHITVVSDGHQWPARYDALGVYSDVDIEILLTEENDVNVDRFLRTLGNSLSNSSLKVETLDGEEVVLLDGYQPTTMPIEIEVPELVTTVETTVETVVETEEISCPGEHASCLWWLALVLAVATAALFDFIHELITRKSGKNEKYEEQYLSQLCTCQLPCRDCPFEEYQMEQKVIAELQNGANLLVDTSGSMTSLRKVATAAAKKVNVENLIAFAESIDKVDATALEGLQLGGSTHGWEAIELANEQGYDDLVIVSDLQFNGKSFDQVQLVGKIQKITAVVPKVGYSDLVLQQLCEIADKVEVLYL